MTDDTATPLAAALLAIFDAAEDRLDIRQMARAALDARRGREPSTPWVTQFWPVLTEIRAHAEAAGEEPRWGLDDHDIERMARQHFESRRHFFEDTTASGICSECGESDDQDFVRVTMHFTDGDG